jgi:quercetin dioxygenase-like cupin family protein
VADVIVSRLADAAWTVGRAGMLYRDLVPGRDGGRVIASHIRIDGGPVGDWVHFHRVRFQIIYCYRGWVRVVYEDQGPPFVLREGDCVLQPPTIRHQVLEASPGLEVVEVTSPAEHETCADAGLALPTAEVRAERRFGGQPFVRHQAAAAGDAAVRDLGIGAATGGLAEARVVRAGEAAPRAPAAGLRIAFVVDGQLRLDGVALGPGDCAAIPAGRPHALAGAPMARFLDVTVADASVA